MQIKSAYFRAGWKTCVLAQEFLASRKVEPQQIVNAKKETIAGPAAIQLARTKKIIRATKGKKIVVLNLAKDRPSDEIIAELIVGPSGNLRAPTLQIGDELIVGFSNELYESVLAWACRDSNSGSSGISKSH
jgi:arsenate reductase-like glutaredoxin family protein